MHTAITAIAVTVNPGDRLTHPPPTPASPATTAPTTTHHTPPTPSPPPHTPPPPTTPPPQHPPQIGVPSEPLCSPGWRTGCPIFGAFFPPKVAIRPTREPLSSPPPQN